MSRGKQIHIGDVTIPLNDFAVARTAILGITKSGKTYAAKGIAEQLLDYGIPIIVFDAIGVWQHLKRPRPGGKGYKIVVAGGSDPDLPLTPAGVTSIIQAAIRENISIVIDLYDRRLSKRQWRDIVRDSFRTLVYENKGVRVAILEEAAEYIPQKVVGGIEETYAEVEKAARMGGNVGLGLMLINQRSQEINKAVLELCDNVVLMRQRGSNAINALEKWMDRADPEIAVQIAKEMPHMQAGECWVWTEAAAQPVKTRTREINSLHVDRRTLLAGKKIRTKPVETSDFVSRLSGELTALIEEHKQNDPKILRQQIRELQESDKPAALEREVLRLRVALEEAEGKQSPSPKAAVLRKNQKAMEAAMKVLLDLNAQEFSGVPEAELKTALEAAVNAGMDKIGRLFESRIAALTKIRTDAGNALKAMRAILESEIAVGVDVKHQKPFIVQSSPVRPSETSNTVIGEKGPLGAGETKVLIAVAQYGNIERDTISVLTGYKRATRDAYVQRLKQAGYVEALPGRPVTLTEAGRSILPADFTPLPTGEMLQQYWIDRLPLGERKIFEVMLTHGAGEVEREELSDKTGFKRATRDAYLQRMRSKKIVEDAGPRKVKLSQNLFD